MLWVLIRSKKGKKIYPRIITKYSSLRIPLKQLFLLVQKKKKSFCQIYPVNLV